MTRLDRHGLAVAILLALLSVLCLLRSASAQAERPTQEQADAALAIAQYAASEASLGAMSFSDVEQVFQTGRRRGGGPTFRHVHRGLLAISRCVLADVPRQARGNCRYARNLTTSDAMPEGWREGEDGIWDNYKDKWRRMYNYALHLVRGGAPQGGWACEEDPYSWFGPRVDVLPAWARIVRCINTRNVGVRRAGR